MAVFYGLLFALTFFHITVSCADVLTTNIEPCTLLEKIDPSYIYLRHKSPCELSTVECSSLLVSPIHIYDSNNHEARKRTAAYSPTCIPTLDSPTTLLLFMLKCGDVHPHPGPAKKSGKKYSAKKNSAKKYSAKKYSLNKDIDFSCLNQKGLHFLHLNIRSLLPKIHELRTLACKTKAAVICISESWIDDSVTEDEIHIDGFCILRNDRKREGGGVCTFIRNDIAFRSRDDLAHDSLETTWFELLLSKTKPIVVGTVYRPPDQKDFIEPFEEVLSKIRSDVEVIILGDFNICVSKANTHLFKKYSDVLNLFSLDQLIKTWTRVTDKSSSIIDHILCNTPSKIYQSGTMPIGLSDHFLIYCSRKTVKGQINHHKVIKIRSLKNYNATSFVSDLSNLNWCDVTSLHNVNDAWDKFKHIFSSVLDKVAPVKEIRLKQRTEPWMNSEILNDIRERDNLLYKFNKDRSKKEIYNEYKKLRNKIQRDIKKTKSDYFLNELESNKNNSKQLWKQLKSLGYSDKPRGVEILCWK